jgi:predicted TIM-barrel enzyme
MPRIARDQILQRLRAKVAQGRPIVGGGAGTGLSAKCEEAGGIDLIVIYNSGRYRMAGRGSLAGLMAYGNANEIVCEMAREVLPVVRHTPVLAGVNGTDPFMITDPFLRRLIDLGFSGVQNFPDRRPDRRHLPRQPRRDRHGLRLEVEMIGRARALDLLTTPYVFCEADARAMAGAGADIVVCHMGLTTGGAIGAETALKLADCVPRINALDGGSRDRGEAGRHRAVPRRPHRDAGRRAIHPAPLPRHPRVLRRVEHGAPADRGGADRADPQVQGRSRDNGIQEKDSCPALTSALSSSG